MSYTLVYNGSLVDGNGGKPVADGAVLLKDKRIHDVGRKADIRLPDADDQNLFDRWREQPQRSSL